MFISVGATIYSGSVVCDLTFHRMIAMGVLCGVQLVAAAKADSTFLSILGSTQGRFFLMATALA